MGKKSRSKRDPGREAALALVERARSDPNPMARRTAVGKGKATKPRPSGSGRRTARRNGVPALGWAFAGLAIVSAIVVFLQTDRGPYPLEKFPIQSKQHIPTVDAPHPPYSTDPPTSGPHVEVVVQPGFYTEPVAPEILVHNLEHSHVVIYYRPDAPEQVKDELRQIAQASEASGPYHHVIAVPRPNQVEDVVLTAWGRRLRLMNYDERLVRRFLKEHLGHGHY